MRKMMRRKVKLTVDRSGGREERREKVSCKYQMCLSMYQ